MPAVNDVGEPCAGEPHPRFDGRGLETVHRPGWQERTVARETFQSPWFCYLPPDMATTPVLDPTLGARPCLWAINLVFSRCSPGWWVRQGTRWSPGRVPDSTFRWIFLVLVGAGCCRSGGVREGVEPGQSGAEEVPVRGVAGQVQPDAAGSSGDGPGH